MLAAPLEGGGQEGGGGSGGQQPQRAAARRGWQSLGLAQREKNQALITMLVERDCRGIGCFY
jgi:hypothetical protein